MNAASRTRSTAHGACWAVPRCTPRNRSAVSWATVVNGSATPPRCPRANGWRIGRTKLPTVTWTQPR